MTMPLIEVHLVEKVFSPEQKRQIIQELTDSCCQGATLARAFCNEQGLVRRPHVQHDRPAAVDLFHPRARSCAIDGVSSLAADQNRGG
jgi:hypothetical protein